MKPAPDAVVAALLPELEVIRTLGSGRLGIVYLARELPARRLVALKLLRRELAADDAVRRRFEREAAAAARLTQSGAVAVHRVGRARDGTPYVVMEYLHGQPLADVLRANGAFDQAVAAGMLAQLAATLAQAHARGLVHGGIRPDNVIWQAERGRAVLTDFCVAGVLQTDSPVVARLALQGVTLGDAAHASPEQLRGSPPTEASDVYSLGVLGYEILTLKRPYLGASRDELVAAHLHRAPRALVELLPGVDPRLEMLLSRCLDQAPARRPPAVELGRRLQSLGPRPAADAAGADETDTLDGDPFFTVAGALGRLPALRGFLHELKRRRVYNVVVLYVAGMFVLLEGADLLLKSLPLPTWWYSLLVASVLAGLPVALVLAWMYDLTSGGLRRTAAEPWSHRARKLRALQAVGFVAALLLAALIAWWVMARTG